MADDEYKEFQQMTQVVFDNASKRVHSFHREWLLEKLKSAAFPSSDKNKKVRMIWIRGSAGFGKTTLMAELCRHPPSWMHIISAHACAYNQSALNQADGFVRQLVRDLHVAFQPQFLLPANKEIKSDADALLSDFVLSRFLNPEGLSIFCCSLLSVHL